VLKQVEPPGHEGTVSSPRRAFWSGDRPVILLCAMAVLGGLGGLAGGRLAWIWIKFDFLNHFLLHFAILAVAGLVGLLVPRARLLAAASVAVVGLAAISIVPRGLAAWESPGAPVEDSRVIRVMSFNTWLSNPDWQAVLREIERQDPDIVMLIEFGNEKAPMPQALLERYPYQTDCLTQPYCHMALLSKFPFHDAEARTGWTGPPQISVHFGPELDNLSVIGIHTLRPPYFRAQLQQIEALGAQVAKIGGARIVMGDFNATPFSRMLSAFAKSSGLKRVTWLPSWPARFGPLPQVAIDHIFISDDLSLVGSARVGDNAGSDHYPVIADIRLPVSVPERKSTASATTPKP